MKWVRPLFGFGALALAMIVLTGGEHLTVNAQDQRTATADPPAEPQKKQPATAEKLRNALERSVTFEFNETPLVDVVNFLRDVTGCNILLDRRRLGDAGIELDRPITLQLSDTPLKTALRAMLEPFDAHFELRDNLLMITAGEEARNEIRVYAVADLVVLRGDNDEMVDVAPELIRVIQKSLARDAWDENGGDCTIDYFAATCTLVVHCPNNVHDGIEKLLSDLRRVAADHAHLYEGRNVPTLEEIHQRIIRVSQAKPEGSTISQAAEVSLFGR